MAWIYRNPLVGADRWSAWMPVPLDHPRMAWIYLGKSAFNCMRNASTMAA